MAAFSSAQRRADPQNIVPHIRELFWSERKNVRCGIEPSADRLLDFRQADGANFALRLGQDHVRPQPLQHFGVDAINGERLLQQRLDLPIDFAAGGVDAEPGRRANRQGLDSGREITFV